MLIFYLEASQDYFKSFKNRAINLLSSNIDETNLEIQFQYKCRCHSIDLFASINQGFYLNIFKLNSKVNIEYLF